MADRPQPLAGGDRLDPFLGLVAEQSAAALVFGNRLVGQHDPPQIVTVMRGRRPQHSAHDRE